MENVIETQDVTKEFISKRGILRRTTRRTRALDKVNLSIKQNEIFGLIGESGSGKTTLGLAMLRLLDLENGKINFLGENVLGLKKKELLRFREKTQMIFQDPYSSLNPVVTVYKSVATPLKSFQKKLSEEEIVERVAKTFEIVGLVPADQFLNKFPGQMSGGQRQRVGIARAIISDPEFIVADEPVSMLDVSLRADILNILINLKPKLKNSMMFISHDITVTQYVSDRIAVMHLGQIVELGKSAEIIKNPLHPYTKTLIESIPVPDPGRRWSAEDISGQISEYTNEGKNECSYANKCPFVKEICRKERPEFREVEKDHFVACVLYD